MKRDTPSYRGYRFPPEIISHAVWLYHRFCLSFRDVEDLLAQRSIAVSYEAIRVVSKNTNELKTRSPGRFGIDVSTLDWGMSHPLLNLLE